MPNLYTVPKLFSIGDLLPFLGAKIKRIDLYGAYPVRLNSRTLQLFKIKGTKCARCGIEGEVFTLNRYQHQGDYFRKFLQLEDGRG